jgi:hypothetical protein
MRVPRMFRTPWTRLATIGVAVLTPLLMGAYYNSCGQWTVGMYPNYPPDTAALLSKELGSMSPGHIHAVTLFMPWTDAAGWYTTAPNGGCVIQTAAIQSYVNGFMQQFNAPSGLELNLHVVFPVHVGTGAGKPFRVGPACLGSNFTLAQVAPAFETFMDATMDIVSSSTYSNMARTVAIGNEVDLYLQSGCAGLPTTFVPCSSNCGTFTEFGSFFTTVQGHMTQKYGGLAGITTTFFKLWDPDADTWRNSCLSVGMAELAAKGSIIFLTYYPINNANTKALSPVSTEVSKHFAAMTTYSQLVQSVLGSQLPMVLQEVGYPTAASLFSGVDPVLEQTTFIDSFFSAWKANKSTIQAAIWWSLFDYGPTDCSNVFGSAAPICSTGLFDATGGEKCEKNSPSTCSWDHFRSNAQAVESW